MPHRRIRQEDEKNAPTFRGNSARAQVEATPSAMQCEILHSYSPLGGIGDGVYGRLLAIGRA
jgi:hypothetical protein